LNLKVFTSFFFHLMGLKMYKFPYLFPSRNYGNDKNRLYGNRNINKLKSSQICYLLCNSRVLRILFCFFGNVDKSGEFFERDFSIKVLIEALEVSLDIFLCDFSFGTD